MTASVHLRGIVIAGVLAAVALALGFVTLAMNQSASQASPPRIILPLKLRHHAGAAAVRKTADVATTKTKAETKVKAKPQAKPAPLDPNYVAALQAGLPRSVAHALAARPVTVVELTSSSDPVAQLAAGEAKVGAAEGGASYVAVNVDRDGGDVEVLTRLLGQLPVAPAALIYARPAKLLTTLPDFNDRTVIQQAAESALSETPVAAGNGWAGKANAICAAGTAQIAALQKSEPGYFNAASAITHRELTQLSVLTPPAGQSTAVHSANSLFEQSMTMLDQTAVKISRKDKSAIPLWLHAMTYMAKGLTVYDRLGATSCSGSA